MTNLTLRNQLTPKQIVEKLDQYIIGQNGAKKSVAVALRNRYRRQLMDESIRDEIIPKNILMIEPTSVNFVASTLEKGARTIFRSWLRRSRRGIYGS